MICLILLCLGMVWPISGTIYLISLNRAATSFLRVTKKGGCLCNMNEWGWHRMPDRLQVAAEIYQSHIRAVLDRPAQFPLEQIQPASCGKNMSVNHALCAETCPCEVFSFINQAFSMC